MEKYIKTGEKLGEGGFGSVIKAYIKSDEDDTSERKVVAIKKLFSRGNAGLDIPTLREIKILREIKHKNLIECLDIFIHEGHVCLVMECCVCSIYDVIKGYRAAGIPSSQVKCYMQQILQGLQYLHENWILHRDIKPSNFLITSEGCIKLTDFGTARFFGVSNEVLEPDVCTIWYRAPELLFGAERYMGSADMWSVGCTFAELLYGSPLFPGESEIDMIRCISSCLGTPCESRWPGVSSLPRFVEFTEFPGTPLGQIIAAPKEALDLLGKILVLDPNKRISPSEALKHDYFTTDPKPCRPSELKLRFDKNVQNCPEAMKSRLVPNLDQISKKLKWE